MRHCKVCQAVIPQKRVDLGYTTTCVNHSSTERYSGLVVADAKATTWIQVLKDPEVARHITALSSTRGKA